MDGLLNSEYDRDKTPPSGEGLLGAFAVLALLGVAALWSASAGYALSLGLSGSHFAQRQIIFLALTTLAFAAAARVSLRAIRPAIGGILIGALALLALPLVPGIGDNRNGAVRWINLGFVTVQPSEFWKPMIVLYLAHIVDRKKEIVRRSETALLAPFGFVVAGCAIIYAQSDFSTAVLAALASLAVLYAAKIRLRFFAAVGTAILPLAGFMVLTSEYRLRRVIGFLAPGYDPHGISYQVRGSVRAISSGGLFGKGLGLGTRKIASIPEVQSDFVFAAFVEETGLLGVLVVFALWVYIGVRVYRMTKDRDDFYAYSAIGLYILLALQFLANVGVVSGFLPATGLALPFFSSGGSSILATGLACGLIYNAATYRGFAPVLDDRFSAAGREVAHA